MRARLEATILTLILTLIAVIPAPERAHAGPPAIIDGHRLTRADGAPFFLLGANYVGAPDRSWTMWQDGLFDAGRIEQDLQKAVAAGLNTLRIFIRSPLQQEIMAGQWSKLDTVVNLAERYGLLLIVTFADYREDDLGKVAMVDAAIARRYAGRRTILAYDLRNEPHFQELAIAQYPGSPPPLQTDALIKAYGERLTLDQARAWRQSDEGKRLIPARFPDWEAYLYANNYRIYREFLSDAAMWVAARDYNVTTLDYLDSGDSAKWRPLLSVLDQTLAAWLKPQVDAVRGADPGRPITVGYSDAILARLSANKTLDFVSIHHFPDVGLKPLQGTFDLLDDLRRAYPNKPIVFEEFGYASADVDANLTARYETALVLHVIGQGLAGGAKWSLNDVAGGANPRENSFGLYRTDGSGKPIVQAMQALGEYSRASTLPAGQLVIGDDPSGAGLQYVYTAPDALFVAGRQYVDPNGRLSYDAPSPVQVFAFWPRAGEIRIIATGPATVRLNPGALVGMATVQNLALHRADGSAVPFQRAGETIAFSVEAGQSYRLQYTAATVDARIEIVWPHGGRPVREARLANVSAYLFQQGTGNAVCPQLNPTVRLWRALNNGVEEEVGVGQKRTVTVNGLTFTAWDFNDIDVAAAVDPRNKYYFRLAVDGSSTRSSVWSHGEDARTYFPNPDVPTGVVADVPAEVDAKIEIVWPHGGKPVTQATKANVLTYLFQHGTLRSVPASWSPTVRLWRSLNNDYAEPIATGQKVMKTVGNLTFPAWEFNDVDVSAATDPLNKYYFRVTVDGVTSRSNVWSHGADARTHFPQQDVPAGVAACP